VTNGCSTQGGFSATSTFFFILPRPTCPR
jgi:hypothetical protein